MPASGPKRDIPSRTAHAALRVSRTLWSAGLTHCRARSASFGTRRLESEVHPKRRAMHNSDYYREQAEHYRQLAAAAENPAAKQEFLELAEACEEAADKMDDCRASG